jgi:Asp-tRNA(Asn)/Glu-tRNA(Gln) amidotransferase C subunit
VNFVESKGFAKKAEVAKLVEWVSQIDNSNSPLPLAAAKALATFIRNQKTDFSMTRQEVCKQICSEVGGCFKQFFTLAKSGKIEVYCKKVLNK